MEEIKQPDAGLLPSNAMVDRQNYKDLVVWQKGLDLVVQVYLVASKFPNAETYGLKSQIERAAVSVPSNIAEGQARGSTHAEFVDLFELLSDRWQNWILS